MFPRKQRTLDFLSPQGPQPSLWYHPYASSSASAAGVSRPTQRGHKRRLPVPDRSCSLPNQGLERSDPQIASPRGELLSSKDISVGASGQAKEHESVVHNAIVHPIRAPGGCEATESRAGIDYSVGFGHAQSVPALGTPSFQAPVLPAIHPVCHVPSSHSSPIGDAFGFSSLDPFEPSPLCGTTGNGDDLLYCGHDTGYLGETSSDRDQEISHVAVPFSALHYVPSSDHRIKSRKSVPLSAYVAFHPNCADISTPHNSSRSSMNGRPIFPVAPAASVKPTHTEVPARQALVGSALEHLSNFAQSRTEPSSDQYQVQKNDMVSSKGSARDSSVHQLPTVRFPYFRNALLSAEDEAHQIAHPAVGPRSVDTLSHNALLMGCVGSNHMTVAGASMPSVGYNEPGFGPTAEFRSGSYNDNRIFDPTFVLSPTAMTQWSSQTANSESDVSSAREAANIAARDQESVADLDNNRSVQDWVLVHNPTTGAYQRTRYIVPVTLKRSLSETIPIPKDPANLSIVSTEPAFRGGLPRPRPSLPSYSSPENAYGQFSANLDRALGKMYCATQSFIVETQGQSRMLLFFATQKGEITATQLRPLREDIQIFSFWRDYSGPASGSAIDWITIQSVAQELPSDYRVNAWNVARVTRSSGYQFTSLRATANELWNAFHDVVNDWYIVLRSALITLPRDKQLRLINIYDKYLLRLAESEEHAAVRAGQAHCVSAGLQYSEITRLWTDGGVKILMDWLRSLVPITTLSRPPEDGCLDVLVYGFFHWSVGSFIMPAAKIPTQRMHFFMEISQARQTVTMETNPPIFPDALPKYLVEQMRGRPGQCEIPVQFSEPVSVSSAALDDTPNASWHWAGVP
ncbi:hypothetical protein MVEN_02320300 [Mycena venus]|uniref:Uncharacterized protein n=1 Tax=Mycena venus TaxID=2733690 RepID=A0A8H6X467_9AGAR|nr:hypothetical protein MVEN_02320300 [Mycena venus]